MQNPDPRHAGTPRVIADSAEVRTDHPFREYISAMATQLADIARSKCHGDESLVSALEQAAQLATRPRDDGLIVTPIHQAKGARAQPG